MLGNVRLIYIWGESEQVQSAPKPALFTNDSISAFGWRMKLLLFGSRQQQATNQSILESVTCSGLVLCRRNGLKACSATFQADMWCGWECNSLGSEPAYNPISYQLGSVWPHDNAFSSWAEAIRLPPRRIGLRKVSFAAASYFGPDACQNFCRN